MKRFVISVLKQLLYGAFCLDLQSEEEGRDGVRTSPSQAPERQPVAEDLQKRRHAAASGDPKLVRIPSCRELSARSDLLCVKRGENMVKTRLLLIKKDF